MGRPRIHQTKQSAKATFSATNREYWTTHDPYSLPGNRTCRKCKSEKARAAFAKSMTDVEGLQSWCRTCSRSRNLDDPRRQMIVNSKRRATEKGIDFNISVDDIIVPVICPVLGLPLVVNERQSHNSPSLDRIDGSKGYVKGNVRVISWRANDLKRDATVAELKAVLMDLERCVLR